MPYRLVNNKYHNGLFFSSSTDVANMWADGWVKSGELYSVFLKIENLHRAIPNHIGAWYFNGNYPTHGGNKVVNRSFINYMEGKSVRAY